MKLLYNTETLESHWFDDDEDTTGYTEKIPVNTGYIFNADTNDWVLKPEVA
jgi:hypothetical protein